MQPLQEQGLYPRAWSRIPRADTEFRDKSDKAQEGAVGKGGQAQMEILPQLTDIPSLMLLYDLTYTKNGSPCSL